MEEKEDKVNLATHSRLDTAGKVADLHSRDLCTSYVYDAVLSFHVGGPLEYLPLQSLGEGGAIAAKSPLWIA